jgi:ABC-type polysaccharide/polyol phosphate export permease
MLGIHADVQMDIHPNNNGLTNSPDDGSQMTIEKANIYDSSKIKSVALEEVKAIIRYKDLLVQLVRRDIVARYKRSALGVLWTMLNPLGTMIILTIVFSRLFDMRGVYPAYIITGLVAWNFFGQTTQFSLNTTLWGSELYHKIYMPRTAFIVSVTGGGLINLTFALVPMLLIYVVTRVPLHASALLLPVAVLLLAMFTLGLSLLLSTAAVFFPDVAEFFPVLISAWMYLTPIIYPEALLMDVLNGWVLKLNPMYHMVRVFRMLIYEGVVPGGTEWLIAFLIAAVTLFLGWRVFTDKSRMFGYYA